MQNREIYSGTNPVFQRVEGDCSYDYLQCFHNFSGQIKVVLFFSNYKRPSDCRTTTSTSFRTELALQVWRAKFFEVHVLKT